MTIGQRIKQLRIANGMTQEDLAKKLNYKDRSTIAYIEKDGGKLSMPKVQEFAKALGVTPEHLMGWDDAAEEINTETMLYELAKKTVAHEELLSLFDSMNEEGQEVALNVLRGLATQYKKSNQSNMVEEA